MIVEIIKGEDKANPLTDEQLANLLKERGINIDRRTVAYYRKGIKLPTATERIKT